MIARLQLRRPCAVLCVLLIALAHASPAHAYLKFGVRVDSRMVDAKWSALPVRYFINDSPVPGVGPQQFREAVDRAFRTWQDVPGATVAFEFAGFTGAEPLDEDGANTLGFLSRPDLDRVLASTTFTFDSRSGTLLEADIFFNSDFPWSTAEGGEIDRYDVQSIALHETGHLLGLGHSALGETELRPGGGRRVIAAGAVMFPIAFSAGNIEGRTLQADDVAGVSDIYPTGSFRSDTGSIQGTIAKNGEGLFGAHVVAFNPRTGALVGNFALDDDGSFVIAGLTPGPYILRVEPLDDGDVESFFDRSDLDLEFAVTFHDRIVVVPRGGTSSRIGIAVRPR